MSDLVVTPSLSAALAKKDASVASVLRTVTAEAVHPEVNTTSPVPKAPAISAAAKVFTEIADRLGELQLPTERRQLSPAEIHSILDVLIDLKPAIKALKGSESEIRTALFNHADQKAIQDGRVTPETKRHPDGWLILDDLTSMVSPDLETKATREVSGGSLTLTPEAIKTLAEDPEVPEVTHADYLEMTQQLRVAPDEKVLAWLRKNPEKAEVLGRAATRGSATISLNLRPKNKTR
jgi:hypothetical protein